jgi:hypothetical protein
MVASVDSRLRGNDGLLRLNDCGVMLVSLGQIHLHVAFWHRGFRIVSYGFYPFF